MNETQLRFFTRHAAQPNAVVLEINLQTYRTSFPYFGLYY